MPTMRQAQAVVQSHGRRYASKLSCMPGRSSAVIFERASAETNDVLKLYVCLEAQQPLPETLIFDFPGNSDL